MCTPEFYELSIRDPEQRATFATLVKKKIETTRFPSKAVLQKLGLYDNILELFTNIGWQHLLDDEVDRNTYEKVVLEILSTMELEELYKGEFLAMSFQLNGTRYRIPTGQIHQWFLVPQVEIQIFPGEFSCNTFWNSLVDSKHRLFKTGYAKASHIRNPVFRMIIWILSHTVFARKDNTSVMDDELFVLWAMLTRRSLRFSHFLLKQLAKQAHVKTGVVCIGGMLTTIARQIDPDIFGWPCMYGVTFLDFAHLRDMKFLRSKRKPYLFVQKVGPDFPLPNANLVRVTNTYEKANWLMNTEDHERASVLTTTAMDVENDENDDEDEEEEEEEEDDEEDEDKEEEDEEENTERGDGSGVGGFEGYKRLKRQMDRMEDYIKSCDAQLAVIRQELTAIRLSQQNTEQAQEAILADTRAAMEMMARFQAYEMSQGPMWPPTPLPL